MPNSADTDSIEGVLARDGVWVSTTAGTSMWPMLRDRRDTVVVRPAEVLLDECASALDGQLSARCSPACALSAAPSLSSPIGPPRFPSAIASSRSRASNDEKGQSLFVSFCESGATRRGKAAQSLRAVVSSLVQLLIRAREALARGLWARSEGVGRGFTARSRPRSSQKPFTSLVFPETRKIYLRFSSANQKNKGVVKGFHAMRGGDLNTLPSIYR